MKPTESYEQLLERFQKRIYQLQERKVERDLTRVEGSLQAVEYLAFGKLPHDGNHDGMKDHKPLKHGNLAALD